MKLKLGVWSGIPDILFGTCYIASGAFKALQATKLFMWSCDMHNTLVRILKTSFTRSNFRLGLDGG